MKLDIARQFSTILEILSTQTLEVPFCIQAVRLFFQGGPGNSKVGGFIYELPVQYPSPEVIDHKNRYRDKPVGKSLVCGDRRSTKELIG